MLHRPGCTGKSLRCALALKVKLAPPLFDNDGGALVIAVSGATVSTVQLNTAGVGSGLPAGSVACTWKLWLPSAKPLYVARR